MPRLSNPHTQGQTPLEGKSRMLSKGRPASLHHSAPSTVLFFPGRSHRRVTVGAWRAREHYIHVYYPTTKLPSPLVTSVNMLSGTPSQPDVKIEGTVSSELGYLLACLQYNNNNNGFAGNYTRINRLLQ